MRWHMETPVYIYGAGRMGKILWNLLKYYGANLQGIIVSKKSKENSMDHPITYSLDEFNAKSCSELNGSEYLIVFAIGNIFTHRDIVRKLVHTSKMQLLYKDCYTDIQDGLFDYLWNLVCEIEPLPPASIFWKNVNTPTYAKVDVQWMPINKLYCLQEWSPRKYLNACEINALDKIYRWFENIDREPEFEEIKKVIIRNYGYNSKEEGDIWFNGYLNQRYDIYKSMNKMYMKNPSFFENNAIWIKRDEEAGIWYVWDGNNRLSFLKLKMWNKIPCRIKTMGDDEIHLESNKWILL